MQRRHTNETSLCAMSSLPSFELCGSEITCGQILRVRMVDGIFAGDYISSARPCLLM